MRRILPPIKLTKLICVFCVAASVLWACSGQQSQGQLALSSSQTSLAAVSPAPVAPPAAKPGAIAIPKYIGTWQGRCTSDFTAGVVKVTLRVGKTGHELNGTYRCEAGTINCRNQVRSGILHGRANDPSFKVTMEDQSWCVFQPNLFAGSGEYSCYNQGALADHGIWRIKRVSGDADPR